MASKPLPSRATGLLGATNCTPDDVYMTIWKRKTVSKPPNILTDCGGEICKLKKNEQTVI